MGDWPEPQWLRGRGIEPTPPTLPAKREVADAAESTAVRSVIDVDILGHIFEQSITDLERLRESFIALPAPGAPASLPAGSRWRKSLAGMPALPGPEQIGRRRKQEGAVYPPAFITRYLVEQALGGVLKARFETLRARHEGEAAGTARKALADPHAYDLTALNEVEDAKAVGARQ